MTLDKDLDDIIRLGEELDKSPKARTLRLSQEWVDWCMSLPEPGGCAHCGAIAGACPAYPNCPGHLGPPASP